MSKRSLFALILTAVAMCLSLSASVNAQLTVSADPNFTPVILSSGLSSPYGVAFRTPSGDLVDAQTGANLVSVVNATSGATTTLASPAFPYEVSVRASDGVAAVTIHNRPNPDQINFYNAKGALLGSITQASFGPDSGVSCLSGTAFDTNGNLYVAGGPYDSQCFGSSLYYFAGPSPWISAVNGPLTYFEDDVIEGLAFIPVPAPYGALYAASAGNGDVWQVEPCPMAVGCPSEGTSSNVVGFVGNAHLSGIAVDPLLGDVYITGMVGGAPEVVRMPPAPAGEPVSGVSFAVGTPNMILTGLTFDSSGNLYVNDAGQGKLWKLSRNASATPIIPIVQGQNLSFTNPNPSMSDQTQTIFIPQSASLNGAVSISVVFVPANQTQLNSRLFPGSTGDTQFFGGGPIVHGSTCVVVPSATTNAANPNCLVTVQKCYDIKGNEQPICTVQEPPTTSDLIQLTSSFADATNPGPAHFAIDFDTASTNTATDITTQLLDCCTGSGGTKSLCSQTYFFNPNPAISPTDFTITASAAVSPTSPATVTVNSLPASPLGFAGSVQLGVSDAPIGISATLSPTSVSVTAGGSATSQLSVGTAILTATADITSFINSMVNSGCIDNSGIANALSSKLATAQSAINSGQIQTAINALTALKSQTSAQAGKHIGTSCSLSFTLIVTGTAQVAPLGTAPPVTHGASVSGTFPSFNAASALIADATGLIHELTAVTNGDPITGFVFNNGLAVSGIQVNIFNGATPVFATPSTTDSTGFYYFPDTSVLVNGVTYTIQITNLLGFSTSSPASSTFTWAGKGQAFNFAVY